MKGMTITEFKEVCDFVQAHHKFAQWLSEEDRAEEVSAYPNIPEHGFGIKYVDCCYDSRDAQVWNVKFRGFGNDLAFSCNHFNGVFPPPEHFKFHTLYDWVMAYLKGDWYDKDILNDCIVHERYNEAEADFPATKPVPKGCKRYFFNMDGQCEEAFSEISFISLKKENAYRKFENWKRLKS